MTFRQLFTIIASILSPRQRRRYVVFQVFFIFAGLLQVAGAGSVAPFVALLSRPEVLHSNRFASAIYNSLGFTSDTQALAAFAIFMVVVLAASNAVAAIAVWLTFRFSLDLGADLQRDLLTCYLNRDYVRLAGVSSSDLINKVTIGAPRFSFNVMLPLMTIANQAAIVLVIVVGLSFYQPLVVLAFAALLGGAYGLLFYVVKRKLTFHGDRVWRNHKKKHKLLSESLGGLKEIRLSGTEQNYLSQFSGIVRESDRSETIVGALGDVPRFLLETIAFAALLLLAVYLLLAGSSPEAIIAIMTLYAVTGYRMLPAAQAIFKSISQIRANTKTLVDILPDVLEGRARRENASEVCNRPVPSYPATVQFANVSFKYPNSFEPVLVDISTTIPTNAMTVLVGHSGSGKSTMADIFLGLLHPTHGTVTANGESIHDMGANWYKAVGYVPQSIFLLDDSIAANVAFGSPLGVKQELLERSLKLSQLSQLVAERPEGVAYQIGERGARLSGGQRQRLGIARALYHDANYLLLDEATSALDGKTEAEIIDTLKELRKDHTIIMIAHRLTTIQAADHIIMLQNGTIEAEGSWAHLIATSEAFRDLVRLGIDSEHNTPVHPPQLQMQ